MRLLHVSPPTVKHTIFWVFLLTSMTMLGAQSALGMFLVGAFIVILLSRRTVSSLLLVSGLGALTSLIIWTFFDGSLWKGMPKQIILSLLVISPLSYLVGMFIIMRRGRIPHANTLWSEYSNDSTLTELEKKALGGGLFIDRMDSPVCRAADLRPGQRINLHGQTDTLVKSVEDKEGLIHIDSEDGPLVLLRRSRLALSEPTSAQKLSLTIILAAGVLNILAVVLTRGGG